MDPQIVDKILQAAVAAPSGDNSQPWSFKIENDAIILRAHPDQDHPLLNVEARGTLISAGAAVENICIAAKQFGFLAEVADLDESTISIRIRLKEDSAGHELYHTIAERHTNRHPYATTLSHDQLKVLEVQSEPHCTIRVVANTDEILRIATASSMMEETALKTQKIHYHFFRSILWQAHENEQGASGLYIRATELPPPIQALFRLIRHWPAMRFFQMLGLPKLAAKSNAQIYAQSGACVAILVDRTRMQDFIAAGRCMQRIWLKATHHGLVAQPLAGLIYLAEYITQSNDTEIDTELSARVLDARREIAQILHAEDATIAMMLRVGAPVRHASARAKRRTPVLV